ncbi:MAG: 5-(carboxyamino)imidazole ribonucleotide synthase [Fuerstiella sp.]|nr:5-(carboxyamino)imidazole ribonucleotide synthase [Fuerstiella sp.]MCP4859004.1 5-(carboxyamino)imidazole ribonucleotide synthase [Fuerstiella sp.]
MTNVVGPGSTIGILGAGQLGRMLAVSARQMGYRIAVFGGDRDSPAGQVSDLAWPGAFDDEDKLLEFARACDVVTYEFENIPSHAAAAIDQHAPLCPGVNLLQTAQNRFAEKTALSSIGLRTAEFRMVRSSEELASARDDFGGAVVLKANTDGYDGKGQWSITPTDDAESAWSEASLNEGIVEERIDFDFELSIVAGRYADGTAVFYDPLLNDHANHILDVSVSAAPQVTEAVTNEAVEMARAVLEHFDVVGVLCIELFLTHDGHLVVNEIAPRPHNSGHLTIEAYHCSQFELQLRTICGLPSVPLLRRSPSAAMANLLGQHIPDAWRAESLTPLESPNTSLHLYGKPESRLNRKMGHITATGADPTAVEQTVRLARETLLQP